MDNIENKENIDNVDNADNTENVEETVQEELKADEEAVADTAQEQTEEEHDGETKPELTEEEKLQAELAETKDKYLRLMAEYDNYRKRTAKQMIEMSSAVKGDTVAELLPIYDNFERAANAESSDETYKSGVTMIFNQLTEAIKKLGVEIIDPTGQPFDPNIANAVSQIEDPELGENVVAQTFQKGYKIGDRVIRYAMVVVANA